MTPALSAIVMSTFGVTTAWTMWWLWRKRHAAEERARRADLTASRSRELAALGRTSHALAHDLGNLLALVHINASAAELLEPPHAKEALAQVREAARSAQRMFERWRGRASEAPSEESAAELVTTLGALLGRMGLKVETRVDGAPPYEGEHADVVCVLENLLLNAAREAVLSGRPHIEIATSEREIRITNPIRGGDRLDERIYEEGISFEGSTGRGLAMAREAAARIGWRIEHLVADDRVTFVVRP